MKLISISIGDVSSKANEWIVDKDGYGNGRLINELSTQRIRVDKYINLFDKKDSKTGLKKVVKDNLFSIYRLPMYSHITSSKTNLNMDLVKTKKNDKSHIGDNVIYVTLSNKDYSLIEYSIMDDYERIIQTFRKKHEFQGCVILLSGNKVSEKYTIETPILSMVLYNIKKKQYEKVLIRTNIFNKDSKETDSVTIVPKEIDDPVAVSKYDKLINGNENYYHGFRISDIDTIITSTVVTDDANFDAVQKLSCINDRNTIICIDNQSLNDTNNHEVNKVMTDYITSKNVRALTVIGNIRIPKDFCIKYKILYLFSYDINTGISHCIKAV
jgi:hypothetical protein